MKPAMLLIGGATERMMERLHASFDVHVLSETGDRDAWFAANGANIRAIATNGHDGVPHSIMHALPNLEIISCYGVGYDAIDVGEAVGRNVVVTHTPDVLNADVANLAILLMLAVSRCLLRDDKWVRSGNWLAKGNAPLTRSIEGKKVGMVGLGRIGATIARKLEAFDCTIAYHTRRPRQDVKYKHYTDLVKLAADSDYLVAIVPGGGSTRHLINRDVIDALGPEGTLINVARGPVVDEVELVKALQDGRLGWAGLDVFEKEPQVPEALFAMENVVLTPHVASATVETRQAMGDLVVDNLVQYFENGNAVTPVPECR